MIRKFFYTNHAVWATENKTTKGRVRRKACVLLSFYLGAAINYFYYMDEERDLKLAKFLVSCMSEKDKEQLEYFAKNHDVVVHKCLKGEIGYIPAVQISFVQTGHIVLNDQ